MASGGGINIDILSDETFDFLCTLCKKGGRNREAEHFCIECQVFYCSDCSQVHDGIPLLKGHTVLDEGDFPSRSSKKPPAQSRGQVSSQEVQEGLTERCDRHTHNFIDAYCQNHDTLVCATCTMLDHRSCQDVLYIPEFVKNNTSETPKEIVEKLESIAKALTECQENFQREKQELLKVKAESLQSIKKFRTEINARLDELEKRSLDELEDKFNVLIHQMEQAMAKLQMNRTHVSSALDKIASSGQNPSRDFINAKTGIQTVTAANKCIDETNAREREGNMNFTGDQKLFSLLEQMSALGDMNVQHFIEVRTSRPGSRKEYYSSGKLYQKDKILQIKVKKTYSVYSAKIKSDTSVQCFIVSACTLEDGTIILSDRNHKKLKRLDSIKYTVTNYYDLPAAPWQVCPIDKQEVAVCLSDKKEIQFISVSRRMKATGKINTDFECYGLAYAKGNLYISDDSDSVYIYSMSGKRLKQLKFSNDQSGQRLVSDMRHLAVNLEGSMIYVVDYNKGLIVMNKNGQVVSTYDALKHGCGCYLTRTGSLLVCGEKASNVLQFGYDGELIGEVYKSEKHAQYQTVCCDEQMAKIILGTYGSNNFYVYDLK